MRQREEIFRKSLYGDDVAACAQADMEFHDAIYAATGNSRLVQILNNLREQMYRYRMEYLKDRQSHSVLVREHEEILNALCARDAEKALDVTITHIERQRDHILNLLFHNISVYSVSSPINVINLCSVRPELSMVNITPSFSKTAT